MKAETMTIEGFGECKLEKWDDTMFAQVILVLPADGPWDLLKTEEELEEDGVDPRDEEALKTLPYGAVYQHLLHYGLVAIRCRIIDGVEESFKDLVTSGASRHVGEIQEEGEALEELFLDGFWAPPSDVDEGVERHRAVFFEESFREKLDDGYYDDIPLEYLDPPTTIAFSARVGGVVKWFLSRTRAEAAEKQMREEE